MLFRSLKSKPVGLTVLLPLLAVLWSTAVLADYDVMLDASGSMKGFSQRPERWWAFLNKIEEAGANQKYQFGDEKKFKPIDGPLSRVTLGDDKTYLGDAVRQWLEKKNASGNLVIITDNVADTGKGGSSQSEQKSFEDFVKKQDSPFSQVTLMIVSLPFKGPPSGNKKDKSYDGPRAFLVYLLSKSGASYPEFAKLQDQLTTKLDGFIQETIRIKPVLIPQLTDASIIPVESKNKDIKLRLSKDKLKIERYTLGQKFDLPFKVRIKTDSNFEINDISLEAKVKFDKYPHLTNQDVITANIKPDKISLEPGELKDFDMTFNILENFKNNVDFWQKLDFALKGKSTVKGQIQINYKADLGNYKLKKDLLEKWGYSGSPQDFTRSEKYKDTQNHIYHLEQLVSDLLNVKVNDIQPLVTLPVELEMRYPVGPLFSLLLLMLFLSGLVWWWLKWLERQTYTLESTLDESIHLSPRFGRIIYSHFDFTTGELWFKVRFLGFGFWISTPRSKKLYGGPLLNAGQQFRVGDLETSDEQTWYLRKVSQLKSNYAATNIGDDWVD